MAPKIRALVSLPYCLYWRKSTNVSFREWLEFLKMCSSVTFIYLSIVHNHEQLHELLHACAGCGFLVGKYNSYFQIHKQKKSQKTEFPIHVSNSSNHLVTDFSLKQAEISVTNS